MSSKFGVVDVIANLLEFYCDHQNSSLTITEKLLEPEKFFLRFLY